MAKHMIHVFGQETVKKNQMFPSSLSYEESFLLK